MKNVQDEVRKRQALLISAAVTLLCLALWLIFIHQNRLSRVNEGMSALITQMIIVFNDNELIADATGVRYRQLYSSKRCGNLNAYKKLDDNTWAINGDKTYLNPATGTLLAREPSEDGRCMFEAADFIRHKISELNQDEVNVHRYIISRDTGWIYWFVSEDARHFSFGSSQMVKTPAAYFVPPTPFYDRLLQKDVRIKNSNATNIYSDKITGGKAYSIVSYIYDLSREEVSDRIVGYLLYDYSEEELEALLSSIFSGKLPPGLTVSLYNVPTGEAMCLTDSCSSSRDMQMREISLKYQLRYALPFYLFAVRDPAALAAIILSPLLFLFIALLLRRRLNLHDIRIYTDPLTGCFTRKIMEFISSRQNEYSVVILMDCNKFKEINDTWGHSTGDKALQIVARQMMLNVRSEKDLVIRTGGDEFVILLNRTPLAEAKTIASRVAERIASYDFAKGSARILLSVSWGVSSFKEDLDATIQLADADMYRMKQHRRRAESESAPAE